MKRREGISKLTGAEQYVDDLPLDDFLWGMVVRSPSPRGQIRDIRMAGEIDWSQFVIVDARDIPGSNAVAAIEHDQPILADGYVRHVHEPVMLLAHPSRDALRQAVRAVEVVVDPDEPVLDFTQASTPRQIQYGDDNVFKRIDVVKGDAAAVFDAAAHIIEGEYRTGAQEHIYLEPQGMIASIEAGVVTVRGSMQCPYFVHSALMLGLGRGEHDIRVIQTPTGGAFGGKEDYPSVIALLTALLAVKANRTVKIIYDRSEDIAVTTKRHPARIHHRTAVDDAGMLQAMVIDVLLDGGAYVTLSPVVLSRAVIHAAGPYFCPNVQIHGEVRLTNHVPYGAFRGFGAPQTQFAMERQMDRIADALGIDRIELRRRNLLRDGQTTATGQVIRDGVDRVALQDRAVKIADVERTREACKQFNAKHPYLRRGVGLSSFYHGAGFTGSGEVNLASRAEVAGLPDGRIEVRTAQTEMGQGMVTVFTQIVAVYVGYAERDIVIADADTAHVPNSGPTVASRTTMVVGRLVERACDDLRRMLGCEEATGDDLRQAIVRWHESHDDAELIGGAQYVKPSHIHWDDDRYLGDAYAAYAWATNIAQVEVDLRTFMTRVVEFTSVQDVGTVLNDVLARGQIQGGVAQAIGWALSEACAMQNGAMQNAHLTDYIIPTASDLPPIRVWFEQTPYDDGPSGAKGIGELPMNGPAPAILSAISDAVGLDLSHIPVTPETLMEEWLAHERH